MASTRREFSSGMLGSLVTFGLVELLWSRDLLAAAVRPVIGAWFAELEEMSRALRGGMRDLEFQAQLEALLGRVPLAELITLAQLDALASRLPERGAATRAIDLRAVTGLPAQVGFSRKLFGCRRGRSIVPHGHANMCTGFVVLRGQWRGRHWDRVAMDAEHVVIQPTIDRSFGPGELSTISDHRDNVHWFMAESEAAYVFNVHVSGYDRRIAGEPGRLYLDPDGERMTDGRIRARRLSAAECLARYG